MTMARRAIFLLGSSLLAAPAAAQQQAPDPAFLTRAIGVLQVQRNQALDALTVEQARAEGLREELTKAQARIKEMESAQAEKAQAK